VSNQVLNFESAVLVQCRNNNASVSEGERVKGLRQVWGLECER
jgi:hypothetical protein